MRKLMLMGAMLIAPLAVQDTQERLGLKLGRPAPAFRLNDHEGHAVAVGGPSKTWTVVAFYPKAATPG